MSARHGSPLIAAGALADRLAVGEPTVLLDVRWALGDPHGRDKYLAGHLPGAVYADLDTELAASATPEAGRHPLPEPEAFARAVRRWGVREGEAVVAYDAGGGLAAARAWWLLRHAGLEAYMLDGGLTAWTEAGLPVEAGDVEPAEGTADAGWGHLPVAEIGDVATWPGTLLDARAAERYRGETEPVDPRAGHIPGARSAPTTENLDASGCFLPADALRGRFAALGIGSAAEQEGAPGGMPVAVYCGSGVTAAHQIAALAAAGIDAALYPGSWSQWSADPARPAATGPHP
ncbi:sulfurtransferase [Arthrobacter ginkgonis]|uniref:Sulfurtransferase n=1 Tax=Arthrobacter ginkgonis TaxID=1630594 RepID=A0ABP7CA58_9MICC